MGKMSRSAGEAHPIQYLARDLTRLRSAGGIGSELNVLERGQGRKQVEGLEHEAHAMATKVEQLAPRRPRDVLSSHDHMALTRGIKSADDVQQRRLSTARWP